MFWMKLGWWRLLQGWVVLRHPCLVVEPIFDIGEPRATSTDGFRLSRGIVAIGGLKTSCPRSVLTSTIPQTVFLIVWFLEVWSSLFLTYCLCISLRLANHDAQWVSKTQNSKIVITRHHSSLRNWLSPSSLMQPFNYYNLFVSTISKTSFSISETWAKVAVLTLASVR